jgi:histidine triad (HIT) family protein
MPKNVFLQMIRGEIEFDKIYEDKMTLAFLDYNPLTVGHTLVIPKQEVDHLDDCSEETYLAIFKTVRKVSKHLRSKLHPIRIALVVHGLDIPHAHVHIVPLYTGDELNLANRKDPFPDAELKKLAQKLMIE